MYCSFYKQVLIFLLFCFLVFSNGASFCTEAAKIKVFLHTQNKTFIWKKKKKKKKTVTKNIIYEKQQVFDSFHKKQKNKK